MGRAIFLGKIRNFFFHFSLSRTCLPAMHAHPGMARGFCLAWDRVAKHRRAGGNSGMVESARVAGSPAHGRRGSTRALVPSRRPAIHHPPLCSALHGWLGTSAGTRGGDGRPAGRTATLPFSFFPVGLARGGGAPGAWSDRGGSRSRGKAGRKGAGRSPGVGRPGAAHSATQLGAPRRAAHNFPRGDATGGRDPVATADANRVAGFGFSRERNCPWSAAGRAIGHRP